MQDSALSVQKYLPAAAGTNTTAAIQLPIDPGTYQNGGGPSDSWRLGRIRASWPAMPNLPAGQTVTLAMQTGADGVTFAATNPAITASIAGSATGAAAGFIDFPLPPNFKGWINFLQSAPAGGGNNTGVLISYAWLNE